MLIKLRKEHKKKLPKNLMTIQSFLNDDDKSYFCGDQPGMTDYMAWPIVQRMHLMIPDVVENYPRFKKYIEKGIKMKL